MKLWRVYNGFMGNGPVSVLIIADTEQRAFELASNQFRSNAEGHDYSERYWTNLEVDLLCEDTSAEFVDVVED